jgi:hypothetical protein
VNALRYVVYGCVGDGNGGARRVPDDHAEFFMVYELRFDREHAWLRFSDRRSAEAYVHSIA